MSARPDGPEAATPLVGGRGTRIPDLRLLLAVHAARQASGPTARLVRTVRESGRLRDDADRMTCMFAPAGTSPAARRKAAGPFSASVAALMAMGSDGEGRVYRGV